MRRCQAPVCRVKGMNLESYRLSVISSRVGHVYSSIFSRLRRLGELLRDSSSVINIWIIAYHGSKNSPSPKVPKTNILATGYQCVRIHIPIMSFGLVPMPPHTSSGFSLSPPHTLLSRTRGRV